MFNIKAMIMLAFALVLGTSAAYMAHGWIQPQAAEDDAVDPDFVEVYVAATEIPYGKSLDKSHLKVVAWPKERMPTGAILADVDIEGKLANQSILPDELIMSTRIADKLPGSRLSSIVTPSKRAITVRVNDVAGVAGFLLPGNRVDVLATRMQDRRAITQTLIQNIKVLAVDQKANTAKDDPIVVRAVTLESDLAEASLLASATEEGTIQLVLRNPEDHSNVLLNDTTNDAKNDAKNDTTEDGNEEVVVPKLASANSSVKKNKKITIIRGTVVTHSNIR